MKRMAYNERFGASGAVVRLKVCADLEVLRPSERQWKPHLRQAADTLYAILGQCVEQERFTINSDKITENLKHPKTKQFAKFALSCSLCSHHKENPTQKMAAPLFALPTHHPIVTERTKIDKEKIVTEKNFS
jgi:hypothetical protein